MKEIRVSPYLKNGRYYAVVRYTDDGERKSRMIALGLTEKAGKREVQARLDYIQEEYEKNFPVVDGVLFVKYLRDWVERRKGFVETSTWEGIKIYAEKHIIPYFEPLRLTLEDIAPFHIRDYYDFKYNGGRCDGKEGGLSIESVIKHKSVLMTALDDAVVDGLIEKNPAKHVKLPAKRSSERKENFLTLEQANKMLSLFKDTPFYALVFTTLYYGLRKSEALGLKWSSVDFLNDTLTLDNVVVKNTTIEEKQHMKTSASYHTYPLIPDVKQVLMEQRAWQNRNRMKYGEDYIESDYVFTWEDGKCFRPDSLTKSFQRILKRNNFTPVIRFHDLRHSTASIYYGLGWDLKDIQFWLRHADIKVTAGIYTHIKQLDADNIPDCLKDVFNPKEPTKCTVLELPEKREKT